VTTTIPVASFLGGHLLEKRLAQHAEGLPERTARYWADFPASRTHAGSSALLTRLTFLVEGPQRVDALPWRVHCIDAELFDAIAQSAHAEPALGLLVLGHQELMAWLRP
jgi:hypothetical protein